MSRKNLGGALLVCVGLAAVLAATLTSADADTDYFWKKNSLPVIAGRVEKVNVKNLTDLPPPDGEESMDTQWSSGIARDAHVRIYAAGTLGFVDLDRGLDRIVADAMKGELRQLSISLGRTST